MQADEVRELVRAVEDRQGPAVELLPGVLQSVSDTQGVVVLDGTTTEIGVNVVVPCSDGDRVMVLFVPPRGGFVIGRYGDPPISEGWNLLDEARAPTADEVAGGADPLGDVTLTIPQWAQDWTRFRLDLTGRNPAGALPVYLIINDLATATWAGATSYYVNGNGTVAAYDSGPTSALFFVEWGNAIENTGEVDMICNGDVVSITTTGARYSNTLGNNRRFFGQARVTVPEPSLQTVRVTDTLGALGLGPTVEFSSVTLYGLNPG